MLAQETVVVKNNPKRSAYAEEYSVLKSDRNVKHGAYKKIATYSNKVIEEGNYKNGKKDGLWTQYSFSGKVFIKGSYTDDVPTGVWEYYDQSGKLQQQYDHTNNTMVFIANPEKLKDTTLVVYNGSDSVKVKVDSQPVLVGGPSTWQIYLSRNLRYPAGAIDDEIMGTVIIGFIIHPDGTASDFWIRKGVHKSLNEEALRVVSQYPHKWVPAKVGGQAVKASYSQPVVFLLEKG